MNTDDEKKYDHHAKKCPECMTYIPIETKVCPVCKKRVGKATESGMARKATDWKSYLMLVISWGALAFYIWWAFLKD